MALSLDDRILGEKTHYYCSSSEDEDEERCSGDEGHSKVNKNPTFIPEPNAKDNSGRCTNTGPKGVIEDWRKYKQLETEKREDQERERLELAKKLSMSCRTNLEDERERAKDVAFMEHVEDHLDEFDEEFLKEYRKKRIESLRKAVENEPKFGKVKELSKEQFLEEIDKENPTVSVIVHIYKKGVTACNSMNQSLECLAHEYPTIKFCRFEANEARLSLSFSVSGVPALLIYKHGELIGNFVRLSDEFGDEFYATDVESFLVEHGMLPDCYVKSTSIRDTAPSDSDSDYDID